MNIVEVSERLQNLINKKVSLAEIAKILGVTRQAMFKRAKSKSDIGTEELQKIENFYGVSIYEEKPRGDIKYIDIPYEIKKELIKLHSEGINLNWYITGKGEKELNKTQQNTSADKDEIIKIVEDYLTKREARLNH